MSTSTLAHDAADSVELDAALIARAREGDAGAFAQLVERHYRRIFSTAYRWLGNRSDAEDVTQKVCMKLADALRGFDERSAFGSWLYRVTLNAARDFQRGQARRTKYTDALALVSDAEAAPAQEQDIAISDLWQAVRALPDKQRDAVLLVYAEELSHAEAAQIMGCRESTVSWHIHKARQALKELL